MAKKKLPKEDTTIYYQGPFMKSGKFKKKTTIYFPGRPFIVQLSAKTLKALGIK
tara:strand:+ start:549 stop:710 length:162 start_codon:yes stop_codon:yes gene_type:complete